MRPCPCKASERCQPTRSSVIPQQEERQLPLDEGTKALYGNYWFPTRGFPTGGNAPSQAVQRLPLSRVFVHFRFYRFFLYAISKPKFFTRLHCEKKNVINFIRTAVSIVGFQKAVQHTSTSTEKRRPLVPNQYLQHVSQ